MLIRFTIQINKRTLNRMSISTWQDALSRSRTTSRSFAVGFCGCREKVVVPVTKPYITFQGAGRDVTVIEWHDRASDPGPNGQQLRTYRTASVTVFANYFSARNISFKVKSIQLSFFNTTLFLFLVTLLLIIMLIYSLFSCHIGF